MALAAAIIQARMGSRRLPGKTLMDLGGRPILRWVIDRLYQSQRINGIVVATSESANDDCIADRCDEWQVSCFRGSENDVLGRFVATSAAHPADWYVRVNADNPFIDPFFADKLVNEIEKVPCDYVSYRMESLNCPVMLCAISFFAEAVSRECLFRAASEIEDPREREHVTLGIYSRPQQFRVRFLSVPTELDISDLRLTVDSHEDLEVLRDIVAAIGPSAITASASEIVSLVCKNSKWCERMALANTAHPKT